VGAQSWFWGPGRLHTQAVTILGGHDTGLPFLEGNAAAAHDRVLEKAPVVSLRIVVAEMRANGFVAGQSRDQDGVATQLMDCASARPRLRFPCAASSANPAAQACCAQAPLAAWTPDAVALARPHGRSQTAIDFSKRSSKRFFSSAVKSAVGGVARFGSSAGTIGSHRLAWTARRGRRRQGPRATSSRPAGWRRGRRCRLPRRLRKGQAKLVRPASLS